MNIIKTIAPIAIEDLKKYFTDKTTFYVVEYADSKLKGSKLITYLSNLDLPADIDLTGSSLEDCYSLLKDYMNSPMLVNIHSLEYFVMCVLREAKGLSNVSSQKHFIEENLDLINTWINKLDSLTLFNMYIINTEETKNFAESFPKNDTDDIVGVNFISLLKHEDFYTLYSKVDKSSLKFYTKYFNEYMFKGKNLYSYWANKNNPLFLLTFAIGNGLNSQDYIKAKQETIQGMQNATFV
jgi:hypothetical protein